jgi:hypothetical protein
MKIIRKIEFTGKNLNDVFALPYVVAIVKVEDQPMLILNQRKVIAEYLVDPGDTLVEYENGK